MASNKRTIVIGMDSTKVTESIQKIDRELTLNNQRWKEQESSMKLTASESEKLAAKSDHLTEKVRLQSEKVNILKGKWEEAKNSKSADEKQLASLENKYLSAKTKLNEYNNELNENIKVQDEAEKTQKSFGDAIRDVASMIGVEASPAVEKLASKFDGVSKETGTAILGIGAMITTLTGFSKELANTADDLLTLSTQTHISTDELQKMQYASSFVDVEVSMMTDSITKLTRNMQSSTKGTGDAYEAFRKLGISVTDSRGNMRDANDVFYESIDALGRVQNETERDALAMNIFGKSARELNPLIEAGSKKMKALGDEAENLGRIIGEDDLQAAGAFKDAMDKMDSSVDSLKLKLGTALVPILTKLVDMIASIPTPVLEAVAAATGVVVTVTLVANAIKSLGGVMTTITAVQAAFNAVTATTAAKVTLVVVAVVALVAAIGWLVGSLRDGENAAASIEKTANSVSASISNASLASAKSTANYASQVASSTTSGRVRVAADTGNRYSSFGGGGSSVTNYNAITIDAQSVKDFEEVVDLASSYSNSARRY